MSEKKTTRFLEIIAEYYRLMDKLGSFSDAPIISPEHRRIAEIVHSCGSVYKPSGAGGGDLGIAFAPSKEIIDNCALQIKKAGFGIVDLNIV